MASSTRHKPTYDEISSIAVRSAMGSYFFGCIVVFVVLWDVGYGPNVFGLVAFAMLVCISAPHIVAATITEVVHGFLLERSLPIPLFVRTCTITVMATLFGWLLLLIVTIRVSSA